MSEPADLERTLKVLRARRAEARERYGIELVGVVGSLARGEARPDSDVDLVVRHVGRTTLFNLTRFEQQVEAEIGRAVDLVFSEVMVPARRTHVERDLVPL